MLTWVPAGLVFYQRHCHATCCCCLRSAAAANGDDDDDDLETCR